ncbi:MAG: hypothetical protein H7290_01505 [Flavobacterium sp.]|nr:hypothetical protein [Aeromicrobium sp.]
MNLDREVTVALRDAICRQRHSRRDFADMVVTALGYFDAWERILDTGLDEVVATLVSRSPASCELRQNSPFAGVLPDATRIEFLASFGRDWDREHADPQALSAQTGAQTGARTGPGSRPGVAGRRT